MYVCACKCCNYVHAMRVCACTYCIYVCMYALELPWLYCVYARAICIAIVQTFGYKKVLRVAINLALPKECGYGNALALFGVKPTCVEPITHIRSIAGRANAMSYIGLLDKFGNCLEALAGGIGRTCVVKAF